MSIIDTNIRLYVTNEEKAVKKIRMNWVFQSFAVTRSNFPVKPNDQVRFNSSTATCGTTAPDTY